MIIAGLVIEMAEVATVTVVAMIVEVAVATKVAMAEVVALVAAVTSSNSTMTGACLSLVT